MRRLDIEQKSPEWHSLRKKSLGASDAPVIMEISPYKTALQLWEEKLGLREVPESTGCMNKGNELEIVARDEYNRRFSDDMVPVVVQSDEYPFLIASLDGMNTMDYFIEIKYNNREVHDDFSSSGNIPNHHICQIQHQFLVTGKNRCHYVSINSKHDVVIRKIDRDDTYISNLISRLKYFWNMLQSFTQPSISEKDYQERSDRNWLKLAEEILDVKRQLQPYEALKKREEELRKILIEECRGKSCVGAGLKLTRFIRKGVLNLEKMCSELSIDDDKLDLWRSTGSESWRLTTE